MPRPVRGTYVSRSVDDPGDALLRLLSHRNIASKAGTIHRYDHEILGSTVVRPLVGRLLAREPDVWDVLHLPALFDDATPLWPERFSLDEVLAAKRSVSLWRLGAPGRADANTCANEFCNCL